MSTSSIIQYLVFLGVVTALVRPAGSYLARVFEGSRTPLDILLLIHTFALWTRTSPPQSSVPA